MGAKLALVVVLPEANLIDTVYSSTKLLDTKSFNSSISFSSKAFFKKSKTRMAYWQAIEQKGKFSIISSIVVINCFLRILLIY